MSLSYYSYPFLCKAVQCKIGFHPRHGSFFGDGLSYRDSILFYCDAGYNMPFIDERLQVQSLSTINLTCSQNGVFDGTIALANCESKLFW